MTADPAANPATGSVRGTPDPAAGLGRGTPDPVRRTAGSTRNPAPGPVRAVYVISVAAELAGVHPQTLRTYERKGLLDPSRTRGGSRRFSDQDLARLRHIQELTVTGLNLEGVRRVLALEAELSRLRAELEQARAEAREAVEQTHRHYRRDLVPFDRSPTPFVPPRRRRTGR